MSSRPDSFRGRSRERRPSPARSDSYRPYPPPRGSPSPPSRPPTSSTRSPPRSVRSSPARPPPRPSSSSVRSPSLSTSTSRSSSRTRRSASRERPSPSPATTSTTSSTDDHPFDAVPCLPEARAARETIVHPKTGQPLTMFVSRGRPFTVDRLGIRNPHNFACCTCQNSREHMEDRSGVWISNNPENAVAMSVFDGHGGYEVAEWLQYQFTQRMFQTLSKSVTKGKRPTTTLKNIQSDIVQECLKLDRAMHLAHREWQEVGSTACSCVLIDHDLFLCNIGDSRAVIFTDDGRIHAATTDHKPERERDRVEKHGGYVSGGGTDSGSGSARVNNDLAMSRAFGDFSLKKGQYERNDKVIHRYNPKAAPVIAEPDVIHVSMSDIEDKASSTYTGEESDPHRHREAKTTPALDRSRTSGRRRLQWYVLIGSDGLWDAYKDNREPVSLALAVIRDRGLEQAARHLLKDAIHRRSTDNITVLLCSLFSA